MGEGGRVNFPPSRTLYRYKASTGPGGPEPSLIGTRRMGFQTRLLLSRSHRYRGPPALFCLFPECGKQESQRIEGPCSGRTGRRRDREQERGKSRGQTATHCHSVSHQQTLRCPSHLLHSHLLQSISFPCHSAATCEESQPKAEISSQWSASGQGRLGGTLSGCFPSFTCPQKTNHALSCADT